MTEPICFSWKACSPNHWSALGMGPSPPRFFFPLHPLDLGQAPELCHSFPLGPPTWSLEALLITGVPLSLLVPQLPPELAYDVLSVADMYLLPGLKRLCGRSLAQLLEEDSVVGVWRIAKLFRLARLEDQCTEYMAKVIEKVGREGRL